MNIRIAFMALGMMLLSISIINLIIRTDKLEESNKYLISTVEKLLHED